VILLTEHEAAQVAKVSWWTIRSLIEKGRLKAANFGTGKRKFYRIDPDELALVQLYEVPQSEPRRRGKRQAASDDGPLNPFTN